MASLHDHLRPTPYQGEHWQQPRYPAPAHASSGPPWGLIVTGLAVAGLGIMAWQFIGPDVRRYLKIESM